MADANDLRRKSLKRIDHSRSRCLLMINSTDTPTPSLVSDLLLYIVRLAPETIKFLDDQTHPLVDDDAFWCMNFPVLLYDFQFRLKGAVQWPDLWEEVIRDEHTKLSLEIVKDILVKYFPGVFGGSEGFIEDLRTVIDVMLIICYEACDAEQQVETFEIESVRSLQERGLVTAKQLQILSWADESFLGSAVVPYSEDQLVVGLDNECKMLCERLTGTTQKKLQLVSVAGMHGIGKTTLARKVYTDHSIQLTFDVRAWVFVSQSYERRNLLLRILSWSKIYNVGSYGMMSEEQLGEELYIGLKGVRYLVVFDDMWDDRAWEELKTYFPDDENGSRIMVTSRDMNLTLNVQVASHPYIMRLRTFDESWEIFRNTAFPNGCFPLRLKKVGKEITRQCGGLPLAIVVAVGFLRKKWSRLSWQQVAENLIERLMADGRLEKGLMVIDEPQSCSPLINLGGSPTPYLINDLLLKIAEQAHLMFKFVDEFHCPPIGSILWFKNFPLLLREFHYRLHGLESRRIGLIPEWHLWEQVTGDEQVKRSLRHIKYTLVKYFPSFRWHSLGTADDVIEDIKTLIDLMLIICYELCEPEDEAVTIFGRESTLLLQQGQFTEKHHEIVSKLDESLVNTYKAKEDLVVGLDEDCSKILELVAGTAQKKLEVISIIGMQGIGKTTLARKVYKHPKIKQNFALRAWISVSQSFEKRDLLLEILFHFTDDESYAMLNDEHLGEEVYRRLIGVRYLVIFDHATGGRAWEDLKAYFPDTENGSRILFTSRDLELNFHGLAASSSYTMRLRTEEESWNIFEKMVFPMGKCLWRLKRVGKEITRKCCGLPLAIAIAAALVRTKWSKFSWQQVTNSLMESFTHYICHHQCLKLFHQSRSCILLASLKDKPTPFLVYDFLWAIRIQIPNMLKLLAEDICPSGIADNFWSTNFPVLLYEFQNRLESIFLGSATDRHLWEGVIKEKQAKCSLEDIKGMLVDYFPVFGGYSQGLVNDMVEDMKTVIGVMLIICSELHEVVTFDPESKLLLEHGQFAVKQHEILSKVDEALLKSYGSKIDEEHVVGFDEEWEILLGRLTETAFRKLQLISIVGMPGLGKTTLARKVFTDPLIQYVFNIRAWTSVSQSYVKRDVLLGVLGSFMDKFPDDIHSMSDEHLGEKLYRILKGVRYLVVLDDVWYNRAWDDLKIYFPDDHNGSRIMLTGRDIELNADILAATHNMRLHLRLRTEKEGWEIFRRKVFPKGNCFWRLKRVGKEITRKCGGLPLSITITAGLLRNNWWKAWWDQVADSLSSYIFSEPNQYTDTLVLSYRHLPAHLRPCFLYLSAFPEDHEIPMKKLIWPWIAMGFISLPADTKSLEDVAEGYLMDLINRSLIMVVSRGSDGGVKACRIHDLLRELCLRKAEEEEKLSQIDFRYVQVHSAVLTSAFPLNAEDQLLGRPIFTESHKRLRVLDIETILFRSFPSEVVQLIYLRYLAIHAQDGSPPPSISMLVDLKMLVISSKRNIVVPRATWSLVNLRHLHIKSGENLLEETHLVEGQGKDSYCGVLGSIQTISQVCPSLSCKDILSRTPNLRKLGLCGPLISHLRELEFPNLNSLEHLRVLKLFNTTIYPEARSCSPFMFPERLKKLTLSNTGMAWEEMWAFSLLPNLEVLKLKFCAFVGERWETNDAEFQKLKFLKLQDLDIVHWEASSDNFPCLQRLLVHHCLKLQEVPSVLGNILTLESIEIKSSSSSATQSANDIQKEQRSMGNDNLKVLTDVHKD